MFWLGLIASMWVGFGLGSALVALTVLKWRYPTEPFFSGAAYEWRAVFASVMLGPVSVIPLIRLMWGPK